jgi:hypothetical protein
MVLPTPETLVWEAPVLVGLDKSAKKWYIGECPRVGEPVRKGQIRKRETSRKPKGPGGRNRSRKLGRSPEVFYAPGSVPGFSSLIRAMKGRLRYSS